LALEAAARDIGIRPLAGSGEADPESLAAAREVAFGEFEVGARASEDYGFVSRVFDAALTCGAQRPSIARDWRC